MARKKIVGWHGFEVARLEPGDSLDFARLERKNAERFAKGGLCLPPRSDADFRRWLGNGTERAIYGLWQPAEDGERRLAGIIGIDSLPRFCGTGVWYGVDEDLQGAGVAKTAILMAMSAYSRELQSMGRAAVEDWVLHAMPKNGKSMRLAKSMGFQEDPDIDYVRQLSSRSSTRFAGLRLRISVDAVEAMARERLLRSVALDGGPRPQPRAARSRKVASQQ